MANPATCKQGGRSDCRRVALAKQGLEEADYGEEEERAPQADLEEELALRAARLRPDMGGGQDLRQGQSEMDESS
nr:hypothetical protein BaRGS_025460 [Batillaria attramentaria]